MKRMFDQFFPDEYMESTYSIPFEKLYQEGYRGVIFDIDNTLVPHGAPADERAKQLFRRLKEIGFESCLLSNNQKKRVEMFNQDVGTHYIFNAHKPATGNYKRAMELMGTDLSSTIFVGDQLFTDVWGAKKSRNQKYSCEADPSKRRDTDCIKTLPGENRSLFLSKRAKRTVKWGCTDKK